MHNAFELTDTATPWEHPDLHKVVVNTKAESPTLAAPTEAKLNQGFDAN